MPNDIQRPCWLGGSCLGAECRGPRFGSLGTFLFPEPFPKRANLFWGGWNPTCIASSSIFCHRTGPEACELVLWTKIKTDFGSIFGPGTAPGRSGEASEGRSGLPGAGKRARSSGLQRIG